MLNKSFIEEISKKANTEKGFKLPLSTLVEGKDCQEKTFKEETVLSYISHQGSSFWLRNPVSLGCELKLIIDIPRKLAEEKNLKLIINGKVAFIEVTNTQDPKQRVSVRFENKYIIKVEE